MRISATSALVLNWSAPTLWQTPQAINYLKKLDLSKSNDLIQQFDETANYWHTQVVSGRKFGMKKHTLEFLKQHPNGQVIILAAGIAPLSIEIAALYPSCTVFDVDQFSMAEKEKLVNKNPKNIQFIECDISNIPLLQEKLEKNGFDSTKPSILIMEGITYYITTDILLKILKHFKQFNTTFTCDFSVYPEKVNEKTRTFLMEVRRKIMAYVGLSFFQCYNENEMIQLVNQAGYKNINVTNTRQIQNERTGNETPFTSDDISWNRVLLAQ